MKISDHRLLAIWLDLFVALILLYVSPIGGGGSSATMRTASDLLSVQEAMAKDGLSGFLPGNHARLNDQLQRQRFSFVIIQQTMVSGAHSIQVAGLQFGTSLVLLKDSGTNTWTVWRDVSLGREIWKSKIGTIVARRPSRSGPG